MIERVRRAFEQPDPTYTRLVEQYSSLITSPTEKLKFLRTALDKYHYNPLAERVGWLKHITFRKVILEVLVQFLPADLPKPREVSLVFWLYRVRYPIYFTASLLVAVTAILTVQWAYAVAENAGLFDLRLMKPQNSPPVAAPVAVAAQPRPADNGELGSDEIEGYTADKIWQVEKGEDFELFSNGARILLQYETESEPRQFYALKRKATKTTLKTPVEAKLAVYYPEKRERPVGILYHVTQSDLLPFSPRYNKPLQGNIEQLLEYVRKEKLYNFLIDRFGRIYRVVKDDHYANHSGNSIWADEASVYINLNHSFIGVAFEGQWSADVKLNPDEINAAQVYAGKQLTEILRSKYNISDVNCVPHGMVSVNPTNFLIGHHLDWASGFPFATLGLRDKYARPPASILEFGFKYDRAFENSIGGELWPGIVLADARLKARAADMKIGQDQLRRQLQSDFTSYRRWLKEMRELEKAAGRSNTSEPEDEPEKPRLFGD